MDDRMASLTSWHALPLTMRRCRPVRNGTLAAPGNHATRQDEQTGARPEIGIPGPRHPRRIAMAGGPSQRLAQMRWSASPRPRSTLARNPAGGARGRSDQLLIPIAPSAVLGMVRLTEDELAVTGTGPPGMTDASSSEMAGTEVATPPRRAINRSECFRIGPLCLLNGAAAICCGGGPDALMNCGASAVPRLA
jgi:hypothetical protein